jgi:iron complex outermembrane receptor protein
MLSRQSLLLSCVCAAAFFTSSMAYAQASGGNQIEELVVTAEKREQSLQDVPVAISAFTSEKRDLVGINSIQDMTNFTPGLNYTLANDRASIRGIGRLTNQHPVATAVAVYDDGIYTTSTVTAGKTPIFTDRVEVVRGPQGTLYGRNSIGGAINVISVRPTKDFYAEVRGTVANYDRTLFEAAMSGPITEGLQFRLAGNWEKQRDGYFDNVVPGMPSEGGVIDQFYLEAQLQAQLGERAELWVKGALTGWNNGSGGPGARAGYTTGPIGVGEFGSSYVSGDFACAPGGVTINAVALNPAACINPANSDPRKFATTIRQTVSLDETYNLAAHFTYHFDGFDFKYVTGGLNYHYTLISDLGSGDFQSFQIPITPFNPALPVSAQPCAASNLARPGSCQPLTIFPKISSTYQELYHNIQHEINFASTTDSPLQWIGGLYYYKEGYEQPVFTTLHDQPQMDRAPANSPIPAVDRRNYDNRTKFQQESYAAYGQIDWKIVPTFTATLGLRYSHDNLKGRESVRSICFATTPCQTTPETLGSFTPPVDVTAAIVNLANVPKGVVPTGTPGGIIFEPNGFATRRYDHSWEAVTGTFGVQWEPDSDTMAYARYSRGYKMGGFASGINSTLGAFPYTAPEHINAFEVGAKKNFGRTLQANIAVFYYDYRNLQAPLTVANNSGGLAVSESRLLNVPRSVSQGFELETIWAPINNLQVTFNYSYNDAHIKRLSGIFDSDDPLALDPSAKPLAPLTPCAAAGQPTPPGTLGRCDVNTGFYQRPQDMKGNSLPQAPKSKLSLNVLYTFDFDAGSLTPSVSYIWRDRQYAGLFERGYNKAPAWDQVDARLIWKAADRHYTIIAYVKNLFDDLGYEGGGSSSRLSGVYAPSTIAALGINPGLPSANGTFNAVQGYSFTYPLTPPRTYGVEVQYRF